MGKFPTCMIQPNYRDSKILRLASSTFQSKTIFSIDGESAYM